MSLPEALRQALTECLSPPLGAFRSVSGGCIHHAGVVETGDGPVFAKWNLGEAATGFTSEARSLRALREAAPLELLDVPEVIDARDASGGGDVGWLVLEYLPPSTPTPDHDERLGRGLAELHTASAERFGWPETNRIGPLPQANPLHDRWADFWAEARLAPQLREARDGGLLDEAEVRLVEEVIQVTPQALAPVESDPPGLVHGDLWAGNAHPGPRGRPVLVDPSSYYGHREVDLAMAHLFGGFGAGVFQAYEETRAVPEGFQAVRCPLYQLYYLLVHIRLFGSSYRSQTRSAAHAVLSAVGRG